MTADRNVIGRRPLKIAYLRLFENQPRMRTFVEGAWREFGTVYLLRGAGSVTPAEYRLAKRSGNPGRMFITSREQFSAILDAPQRVPNPKGRYIFRSIGATTIRVRDRYGSYGVRALLCHGAFWKAAIDMLLARMDLVVLDLSGFRPQNVGTGYEVQRVIDRFPIEGIVFLADQRSNGKFLAAQLQQSWSQMAAGSPNATRGPRVAMIVVTDYYARSQSQAGGQGGQASNVQVRLVARRSQTRRVAAWPRTDSWVEPSGAEMGLGHPLGNDHSPRVEHDLPHLLVVDGIQADDQPVVPEVRRLGHHELLRLGGDECLALLLGKPESHQRLVTRERQEDDPPDPELHPVPNHCLVRPRKAQGQLPHRVDGGHRGRPSRP